MLYVSLIDRKEININFRTQFQGVKHKLIIIKKLPFLIPSFSTNISYDPLLKYEELRTDQPFSMHELYTSKSQRN